MDALYNIFWKQKLTGAKRESVQSVAGSGVVHPNGHTRHPQSHRVRWRQSFHIWRHTTRHVWSRVPWNVRRLLKNDAIVDNSVVFHMEPEWRAITYQEDGGGEEEEAQTVVVTTVSCSHGRSHHLAAYRGKVFVLDSFSFWGHRCCSSLIR